MAAATHATCLCDEPYVCCSCYIQVWSISRSYFYPLSVSVSVSELCLWLYLRLFSVSVYVSSLLFSLFFLSLSPGKIKYVLSKERRMMILYLSIRSFYSRTKFDVLSCLIHVSTSTQRMSKSAGWSSTRKICGACYCKGQIGYFFYSLVVDVVSVVDRYFCSLCCCWWWFCFLFFSCLLLTCCYCCICCWRSCCFFLLFLFLPLFLFLLLFDVIVRTDVGIINVFLLYNFVPVITLARLQNVFS